MNWTTEDEMDWLKKIGKSCKQPVKPLSTLKRLTLYRNSIDQRNEWRGMDKEKIRLFVQALIDKISKPKQQSKLAA